MRLTLTTALLFLVSISAAAQSIAWRLDDVTASRPQPLTQLSDGNLLQLIRAPEGGSTFQIVSPEGERLEGIGFSDCCDYVYLEEVGPDSIFALRDDGQCFLVTERITEFIDLGNAFPALTATRPIDGMRVLSTDNNEVIALAWGDFDGQYEARVRYTDSLEVRNRVREWEDIWIAYGPNGLETRVVSSFPATQILTSDASGLLSDFMVDSDYEVTDMFYGPDGKLRLLGYDNLLTGPAGYMFKIDPVAIDAEVISFDEAPFRASSIFNSHYFVGEQIILTGQRGGFGGWAIATGVTTTEEVVWSFDAADGGEGPQLSTVTDLVVPDGTMSTVYLAGEAGQTDVAGFGNAYLLRLDEAPLATAGATSEPLSFRPNPAFTTIALAGLPPGNHAVGAYDVVGRRVALTSDNGVVDVSGLTPGVYALRVVVNGVIHVGKLVRQR